MNKRHLDHYKYAKTRGDNSRFIVLQFPWDELMELQVCAKCESLESPLETPWIMILGTSYQFIGQCMKCEYRTDGFYVPKLDSIGYPMLCEAFKRLLED